MRRSPAPGGWEYSLLKYIYIYWSLILYENSASCNPTGNRAHNIRTLWRDKPWFNYISLHTLTVLTRYNSSTMRPHNTTQTYTTPHYLKTYSTPVLFSTVCIYRHTVSYQDWIILIDASCSERHLPASIERGMNPFNYAILTIVGIHTCDVGVISDCHRCFHTQGFCAEFVGSPAAHARSKQSEVVVSCNSSLCFCNTKP